MGSTRPKPCASCGATSRPCLSPTHLHPCCTHNTFTAAEGAPLPLLCARLTPATCTPPSLHWERLRPCCMPMPRATACTPPPLLCPHASPLLHARLHPCCAMPHPCYMHTSTPAVPPCLTPAACTPPSLHQERLHPCCTPLEAMLAGVWCSTTKFRQIQIEKLAIISKLSSGR